MSLRARKIILLVFLAAFAVSAPAVVLYTSGYRYNWRRNRVEKTGILKLASQPAGARIYLNGEAQPKLTPTSIFRLLPEEYVIRMEKTGYFPWNKTLEIVSGETTFADNVVLTRDALPQLLESGDVLKASFSPDGGRIALLRRNKDWLELAVYSLSGGASTLVARFGAEKYSDTRLDWSPDGERLLFSASPAGGPRDLFLYSSGSAAEPLALHRSLPRGARLDARWSDDSASLTVVTGVGVYSVSAATGEAEPLTLLPQIEDAAATDRGLFLLRYAEDKTVLERTEAGSARAAVAELPAGDYVFTDSAGQRLIVTDRKAGKTWLAETDGRLTGPFDATAVAWEKPGGQGRLLLWNSFEISTYDPSDGSRHLVTRVGTLVTGCAWHPAGQDVIYSTPSSIVAIELDDRDNRNAYDLARFNRVGEFRVDPNGKRLIFSGAVGSREGIFERTL